MASGSGGGKCLLERQRMKRDRERMLARGEEVN